MDALQEAQDAQALAEARLATLRASAQAQAIESAVLMEGSPRFATGDPRPYASLDHYGEAPRTYQQWAAIHDAITWDGRDLDRFQPYYLDEQDLSRKRAEWRNVGAFSSVAIGANESRKNYVLGSGYTFEATPAEGMETDEYAVIVQKVIDQFVEDNEFDGTLDSEIFDRTSEDGETFLGLYPRKEGSWRTNVRIIEPDQVTEPLKAGPIEEWLGLDGINSWWHGVHTQAIQIGENAWIDNVSAPLGFHIIYDATGEQWDYLTVDRCHHMKRNTPINARRGVSDYMAVLQDIELETKLRKNTGEGAAIQAAIAYIKEHPPGVSQSSIESLNAGLESGSYQSVTEAGAKEVSTRKFNSGTILDVGQAKYNAGPMGNQNIFIDVASYLMRSIGVRWNMPEYMISADASNANYASTLVSESPFVKARERDQRFYQQHFKKLAWKATRIAWEAGQFRGIGWEELQKAVTIEVEAPDVASRDRMANAQEKQILSGAGIVSKRTWAAEAGYDYDEERGRIDEEPQAPVATLESRVKKAADLLWEGYP